MTVRCGATGSRGDRLTRVYTSYVTFMEWRAQKAYLVHNGAYLIQFLLSTTPIAVSSCLFYLLSPSAAEVSIYSSVQIIKTCVIIYSVEGFFELLYCIFSHKLYSRWYTHFIAIKQMFRADLRELIFYSKCFIWYVINKCKIYVRRVFYPIYTYVF